MLNSSFLNLFNISSLCMYLVPYTGMVLRKKESLDHPLPTQRTIFSNFLCSWSFWVMDWGHAIWLRYLGGWVTALLSLTWIWQSQKLHTEMIMSQCIVWRVESWNRGQTRVLSSSSDVEGLTEKFVPLNYCDFFRRGGWVFPPVSKSFLFCDTALKKVNSVIWLLHRDWHPRSP